MITPDRLAQLRVYEREDSLDHGDISELFDAAEENIKQRDHIHKLQAVIETNDIVMCCQCGTRLWGDEDRQTLIDEIELLKKGDHLLTKADGDYIIERLKECSAERDAAIARGDRWRNIALSLSGALAAHADHAPVVVLGVKETLDMVKEMMAAESGAEK